MAEVTGFKPGTKGKGNEHLVGAIEFSTTGEDGRFTPIAWVSSWTDEERREMTQVQDGIITLSPNILGHRGLRHFRRAGFQDPRMSVRPSEACRGEMAPRAPLRCPIQRETEVHAERSGRVLSERNIAMNLGTFKMSAGLAVLLAAPGSTVVLLAVCLIIGYPLKWERDSRHARIEESSRMALEKERALLEDLKKPRPKTEQDDVIDLFDRRVEFHPSTNPEDYVLRRMAQDDRQYWNYLPPDRDSSLAGEQGRRHAVLPLLNLEIDERG
ncbi:MAG: hypothetical protein U0791_16450 [Gemmataceae bacterium]